MYVHTIKQLGESIDQEKVAGFEHFFLVLPMTCEGSYTLHILVHEMVTARLILQTNTSKAQIDMGLDVLPLKRRESPPAHPRNGRQYALPWP
ncbi:hypothetical protein ES702_00238 [subsurface metagenome]